MKGPYYVVVNDAQGFFIKVDISLLFTNLGIVVIMHQKVLLFHVRKEGKHGIRYLDVPLFEITYHHLLKGRKWGGEEDITYEDTKFWHSFIYHFFYL